VLIRQHGRLDLALVRAELKPLLELKGALEAMDHLEQMVAKVQHRLRARGAES